METTAFHDRHFDSIQALRGISALFIVLEHIRFLNCGAFGVDIFFCISGFMIMFTTHKSTKYFLRKRLIRILPLYYCMTLGTYLLLLLFPGMFAETTADPVFLIKSLLFIPFDIGGGILQPLMRIGWTINCEIFFYLLFFIALHLSHRFRGLLCSIMLCGIIAAARLLPVDSALLTFYGNPVMLDFVLGILCYYVARGLYRLKEKNQLPKLCLPASISLIVLCFAGLLITKPSINILGFRRPLVWGLPGFALVLCFFILGLYTKLPSPLVRLGNMSFSLYLVHYYPVMLLDRLVFDFSTFTLRALFGVAVSIALCVLFSCICHEIMEKRLSGWLRSRLLPSE